MVNFLRPTSSEPLTHESRSYGQFSRAMLGWPRYVPTPPPPVTLDELERFLVAMFLRGYVTYCIRRRRFDSANAAAALFRRIATRMTGDPNPFDLDMDGLYERYLKTCAMCGITPPSREQVHGLV